MFHLLEREFGALVGTSSILCGHIWDMLYQGLEFRLFTPGPFSFTFPKTSRKTAKLQFREIIVQYVPFCSRDKLSHVVTK